MPGDRTGDARAALGEFARHYNATKAKLDLEAKLLLEQRDQAIVAAFNSGLTTREIATIVGSISHQRVAQIVQTR